MGRQGIEEEDAVEEGDEVELLGAGHGLTHVGAGKIRVPGVNEGLEL